MAYPCRQDGPGTLHHVGNRTVDGWFCFQTERHHRVFMYAWACMVRRGWVRLRSYVLMGNHYHVVLMCLNGNLGETVRQVEIAFTHYSNMRRQRKGPAWERRYWSRPIESIRDELGVYRYIDENPLVIRGLDDVVEHPYGSARQYQLGPVPPWLDTSWMEPFLEKDAFRNLSRPEVYRRLVYPASATGAARLAEQRLGHRGGGYDPLDEILTTSAATLQSWLKRQACPDHDVERCLPVIDVETAVLVPLEARDEGSDWLCNPTGARRRPALPLAAAGILRDLVGLSLAETARRVGCTSATAAARYEAHCVCLAKDQAYLTRYERLARACLVRCHGEGPYWT